jgi:integrase
MVAPDPFVGSFRLATKTATRNTVGRVEFTPKELSKVYAGARDDGDGALADLIARGAYTGARIEELCSLTVATSADGVFTFNDSKTTAGIRQIPIHPVLRRLVKRLQKAGTAGG